MDLDIYDFDKTIVPFDSGSTFLLFCVRKYPYLILLLPFYLVLGALYGLRIIGLDRFKRHIFAAVRFIPLEKAVRAFWDKHERDMFPWFLPERRARYTVVISASPDFLLREIAERLKIDVLLCTRHDAHTGTLLGKNCRGEEKVRRFQEAFPDGAHVCTVYSDSYRHDRPIFSLGERCVHIEKDGTQTEFSYAAQYGEPPNA